MCFERIPGINFIKNYPKEKKCNELNEKPCGGKDSGQLSLFCVPINTPCPIT